MGDIYSMKDLIQNLIAEVKQKKFLDDLWKQNTLEMDNYFKYSGKTEENNGEYRRIEDNEKMYKKWIQQNPKADAMREHMQLRWIENRYKTNKKDRDLWNKE